MTIARGYIRSSTDDQKLTIESQEADIRSACAEHGWELVQLESDPGVSGSRAIEKCEGLARILAAIRPGEILVVLKRDRLSRRMLKQFLIEEELADIGASLHSLDGANGESDEEWAQRVLQAFFSEYELRKIRARTRRAAAQKRTRGERWGQVPYGFTLDEDGPRNDEGRPIRLVPCEDEQAVVESIRSMRDDAGLSLREIADYLNDQRIPSKNGKPWRHTAVASILGREVSPVCSTRS